MDSTPCLCYKRQIVSDRESKLYSGTELTEALAVKRYPLPLAAGLSHSFQWLHNRFMRGWVILQILPPFFKVAFTRKGFLSRDGRTLIAGKARRSFISLFPPLARGLQKKYALASGCTSCGTSCKLLFQCPHWDERTHLCKVYKYRPEVCRLFPITPADIHERNIVARGTSECGFQFKRPNG